MEAQLSNFLHMRFIIFFITFFTIFSIDSLAFARRKRWWRGKWEKQIESMLMLYDDGCQPS